MACTHTHRWDQLCLERVTAAQCYTAHNFTNVKKTDIWQQNSDFTFFYDSRDGSTMLNQSHCADVCWKNPGSELYHYRNLSVSWVPELTIERSTDLMVKHDGLVLVTRLELIIPRCLHHVVWLTKQRHVQQLVVKSMLLWHNVVYTLSANMFYFICKISKGKLQKK